MTFQEVPCDSRNSQDQSSLVKRFPVYALCEKRFLYEQKIIIDNVTQSLLLYAP
jgi:hypothetical protein